MQNQLHTDIRYLKGVGEKRAGLFQRLGVDSIDALLHFYPRAYEDWSKTVSIAGAPFGESDRIPRAVQAPDPQGPHPLQNSRDRRREPDAGHVFQ